MENGFCASNKLFFVGSAKWRDGRELCPTLEAEWGGASGEKHLRIDCASEAALIRNSILGLGQCPGVVGHVPDNVALTIEVGLLSGA